MAPSAASRPPDRLDTKRLEREDGIMAFTRGRCTNFDYCSIAESRRDIEVKVGEDFVCPECGKPLKAPQMKTTGSSPVVPALIGVGVLALVGGAVFLGMRLSGGTPAAQAPAPAPVPVRQATAPAAPKPAPSPAPAAAAAPGMVPLPAENVLFRLDGSRAMATSLIAPLASAYLTQIGDTGVTASSQGTEMRVTGLRGETRESIVIMGQGAASGFAALAQGGTDIVMSPRRIMAAEQSSLSGLGDMTSPAAEHVLALDAQAVIVNAGNPVPSLTREQVRGIFAGTVTDWGQVGGSPGPIAVYAPAVPGDLAGAGGISVDTGSAKRVPSDADVAQAVTGDPRAVGLVDLTGIGQARVVPIAETGAVPVSPTNHSAVAADDYPLTFRLYLYTSPQGGSGFAQRFVDYALSAPGQQIVEQHGLISPVLTPKTPVVPQAQTDTDRLRAFVAGAKRLAIVFHFKPNSTDLDQYGERDVDRVRNYLLSMHDGGDHLLLAGFADNQGDAESNVAVSKKRADAVAALFERRGVTPGGVAGFGAALPVADNGTEAGRERNRRVEVYIKP
jgi:phosphate transport system substrate-binding protein